MKDVAREAGVSIGTVDRVLHNRGRFSPDTADRVRAAAAALNFQPNLVASNLKRAQWRTMVAVLPHPQQDGGFWQLVVEGINRAVQQLAHHYVRVRFAHYDRFRPESFAAIAEELVREAAQRSPGTGIDTGPEFDETHAGIILAPTLQSASAELARRCGPVPVVVLDGELPDVDLLCSISQESYESGLLAAKLLHLMAGPGRYASVVVGREDYHLLRRRSGFEDYFHGSVATERIEAASEQELRDQMAIRARRRPAIDGIFVTNAAAHTVIDAMSEDGASPEASIVGYDLIPENIARLRDGSLTFVINQQPENQGYQAVYALYRHSVLKERVEHQIRIPVDLVTRETLQFHQLIPVSEKG